MSRYWKIFNFGVVPVTIHHVTTVLLIVFLEQHTPKAFIPYFCLSNALCLLLGLYIITARCVGHLRLGAAMQVCQFMKWNLVNTEASRHLISVYMALNSFFVHVHTCTCITDALSSVEFPDTINTMTWPF